MAPFHRDRPHSEPRADALGNRPPRLWGLTRCGAPRMAVGRGRSTTRYIVRDSSRERVIASVQQLRGSLPAQAAKLSPLRRCA